MKRTIGYIFIIFFINIFNVTAQQDYLKFRYLNTDQGLAADYIQSVYKDKLGFLWVGTAISLDRYDGYKVHNYYIDNNNPDALWGNEINLIYEDQKGNIWVSTNKGLNKLDRKQDKFYHYFFNDTAFSSPSYLVFENDSMAWVGGASGLAKFNLNTNELKKYKHIPNDPHSILSGGLGDMVKDSEGNLWITSWGKGISRYVKETDNFIHYLHNPSDPETIFQDAVFSICPDKENGIWVAGLADNCIARLDKKTGKFKRFSNKDVLNVKGPTNVWDMDIDAEGNIWFGTQHDGIIKYDVKSKKLINFRKEIGRDGALCENIIRRVYCDPDGIVWLGSINNGISYFKSYENKARFYSFDKVKGSNFNINYYCKDIKGDLWIASTKGILKFDHNDLSYHFLTLNIPEENQSFTLAVPLSANEIYFKTASFGLILDINTEKYRIVDVTKYNFKFKDVTYFDNNGNLYVKKDTTLIFYKNADLTKSIVLFKNRNLEDMVIATENNAILSIDEDDKFAYLNIKQKIYKIDKVTGKMEMFIDRLFDPEPLNYGIHGYFLDGDSLRIIYNNCFLSVSVKNKGRRIKQFDFIKEKDVIPLAFGFGRNKMCFSTFRGIYIYDVLTNNFYRPDIFSVNSRNQDVLVKFNDSTFVTEVGNGLAAFNPASYNLSQNLVPKIALTNLYLFNIAVQNGINSPLKDHINLAEEIKFNHKQYSFSLEFSLLNYENTEKINYAYMLEGFEEDWNYIGNRKVASYTNLPPGEYIFKCKGKGIATAWSEIKSIKIVILPAFWQTTWFLVLSIVFFILAVYLIILFRVRRVQLQKERLEKIVKERTKEIIEKNQELSARNDEIAAQNEEIKSINEEVEAQRERLAELYQEVTDSIITAQRIQEAILPQSEEISNSLPGHFIFNKPKDIVSGDFYWYYEKFDKIYIAAVDCTGHGVSGAFMSLIGKTLLDKIVIENPTINAGEILDELSTLLVSVLHQEQEDAFTKDGMDIALCIIDKEEEVMQFAGANNPLFIKKGNELEVVKGDAFGIGLLRGKPARGFVNHTLMISTNEVYYIFSDGYVSQFGGPGGEEKLKMSRFKEFLSSLSHESLAEQKLALEKYLDQWQGSTLQTDDILVIGFKL